jgi:nucleoside-diphosphate-sugar epimerase
VDTLLITGATGFVGGYLVEKAITNGFKVVATRRKNSDLQYINHLPLKYVEFDFSDSDSMAIHLKEINPSFIILNAGLTKAKTQSELDLVNCDYSIQLCEACIKANIDLKKIIYISSLASYGPADLHHDTKVRDTHTPQPVTMYGRSKLKAEEKIKKMDLPWIILRPTAVYGPREKDLFTVFKMTSKGLSLHIGKGDQKLTFIYIEDLVELVIRTLKTNKTKISYFVGDGEEYTAKELNLFIEHSLNRKNIKIGLPLWLVTIIAYISEFVGNISGNLPALNRDKLHEIKANNWLMDVEPIFEDTGYRPKTKLKNGVEITTQWYKNNKWI